MKYKINNFLIQLFYRKLRLPKSIVYNTIIVLHKIISTKSHKQINYSTNAKLPNSGIQGYVLFNEKENSSTDGLIDTCKNIFSDKKLSFSQADFQNNPNKDFLLTIESDEALLAFPGIKNFIKSDYVIDRVSSMLQSPFVINSARLWWSPANTTEASSQLYHFDEEDLIQVKLFINILEVSDSNGPFTFLPHDKSSYVAKNFRNGKRRYTDDDVYQLIDKSSAIQLVGKPGSGAFIDTSKCMHYGSRMNESDRLVLMIQFLRIDAPLISQSLKL